MKREIIDGNTACAKASYKLSEICFTYPITPASPMAEFCDELSAKGEKNIFGNVVDITEMQSEAGAIGALHGSSLSGCVSSTFTSSQGLLLMLPNMYKIAGEMLPCVINVASRSVASHALNIFCDHSDVMSARQTGFAMLSSSNPQEAYDFAVASFLASMKSRIPFLHFFDGFRTSHQISVVNTFDDEELKTIYPHNALSDYKQRSMSPNNPKQYGTNENGDIFFQGREKSNLAYSALPEILENVFANINKLGAGEHHIMEYYGSKTAKHIIVAMASACDTIKELLNNENNNEYGLVKINLYRPFDAKFFLKLLPETLQTITVLDRTKEQGSLGEPLYLDILSALNESDKKIKVLGGRYGLGGKEFSPAMVKAVFENAKVAQKNHFMIGIFDDVTNSSLDYDKDFEIDTNSQNYLFYGIGSDGTVTATKNIAKILGKENYVQAYFMYDSKKSGGLTRSYLSIDNQPIQRPYLTNKNDIVVCANAGFLTKYNIASQIKDNGILLVNSKYKTTAEFERYAPNSTKREIAKKNITIYSIDANKIAAENNLQGKISSIMQMAFFAVLSLDNFETYKKETIDLITKSLNKKGQSVVEQNIKAINDIKSQIVKIETNKTWINLENEKVKTLGNTYLDEYLMPVLDLNGDDVPVSKVNLYGENQTGTSKFEKRNVASSVPKWISEKCIECGKCTFVCPHAALRAKLLNKQQLQSAPKTLEHKTFNLDKNLDFHIEVSPADCLACGLCENVCPTHAINLVQKEQVFDVEKQNYEYTSKLTETVPNVPMSTIKTQFMKPYFEFSGACAGCGETPYIKLLTQLFGKNLIIANATGCSSIYGGAAPTCPYTKDQNGFGPAWANSLFEDNAEFGLGIEKAQKTKRNNFVKNIKNNINNLPNEVKSVIENWLNDTESTSVSEETYLKLKSLQKKYENEQTKYLFENLDQITPKSVWIVGGDGWAYDIDFGGLDHVLASSENVNILVLDTELYSNTGGQTSKSTPRGAVAKFSTNGKKTSKKNLVLSALQYKDVYVAEVCFGANMQQTINAFVEAQNYNGVSIIIAYAPCINHGIDMSKHLETQQDAIKCGYWHLFRYNPKLLQENKNPMQIDNPKPTGDFENHLLKERRFANLVEKDNDTTLLKELKKDKDEFYELLQNIKKMFDKQ